MRRSTSIIVDSTDPIGVGEVLFTDEFYQNCARILTAARPGGEPVRRAVHAGRRTARHQRAAARTSFHTSTAYVAAVPTYVGGFMTLGWAAKDAALTKRPGRPDPLARASGRHSRQRRDYWTPEIHAGGIPPAALYRTASSAGMRNSLLLVETEAP